MVYENQQPQPQQIQDTPQQVYYPPGYMPYIPPNNTDQRGNWQQPTSQSHIEYPAQAQYPQFQQQYAPQQVVYAPQPVSYPPPVTATPQKSGDDSEHLIGSVLIFIFGWMFFIPWVFGFLYIRSRNITAKILAIISIVMFFLTLMVLILILPIIFAVGSKHDSNDW
ncbi:hypothetical protein CYY_000997 [Polysphondylium violaceum]|uniref:Uncharacterized protein n=1 Tax=Polysphondylium violaceum TaxID=133409 RepID=A0A8J4Q9W1_9MYCE|nr:hypothetical protein CYY_000997 [Polysphondylium violaceum]